MFASDESIYRNQAAGSTGSSKQRATQTQGEIIDMAKYVPNPGQSKLLIVDDYKSVTDLIKSVAEELGYSVRCVHDFDSIEDVYQSFQPDVIFLDLKLDDHDGIEVLHLLADKECKSKIFLISGVDKVTLESATEVGRLHHLNVVSALKKPFSVDDVGSVLDKEADSASEFASEKFTELLGPGEFRVLYQPGMAIESLAGQGVSDVDISIYWHGERRSRFLTAREYYPELEGSGLSLEFCRAAIETCIKTYSLWTSKGLDFGLVIRLLDNFFLDEGSLNYLLAQVATLNIDPGRLTFGVSENGILNGSAKMLNTLVRLRINGFNVSAELDSADTSQLEKLLHLPVNEIRLARNLVHSVVKCVDTEFDVSTLISFCNKQGLATRAEGVDTESLFEFLYHCGCSTGMGRYFAEPLPSQRLEEFISQSDGESTLLEFSSN